MRPQQSFGIHSHTRSGGKQQMPRFTGFGSVVRTMRRLFVDLFGGETRDEIKPLNIDVAADRVDPTVDETIPVEVTGLSPDEASTTLLGPRNAFEVDERDDTVAVAGRFEDRLTRPTEVMDFDNPHMHGKLMHFRTADVPLPDDPADREELSLGLGVFPDGPGDVISLDRWDSDRVAIPPRGTDN
jgi:hypothetical protein